MKKNKPSPNELSFWGHFDELRVRLLRSTLVVFVLIVAGFFVAEPILKFLLKPYGSQINVIDLTEPIAIYFRVALTLGVAVASPYLFYEALAFFLPALGRHEKRWLFSVIPGAALLFGLGVLFAWVVLIPAAIQYLASFATQVFKVEWTASNYIPFVLSLVFWIGVTFELPLIIFFLAWLDLVTPSQLWQNWRLAVVGCAIVAAAITPTVDPFNMMLVAVPLFGLYLLSILLAFIPRRLHAKHSAR